MKKIINEVKFNLWFYWRYVVSATIHRLIEESSYRFLIAVYGRKRCDGCGKMYPGNQIGPVKGDRVYQVCNGCFGLVFAGDAKWLYYKTNGIPYSIEKMALGNNDFGFFAIPKED